MDDIDFPTLRNKFIEQINNATTKDELEHIRRDQFEQVSELVKRSTGYKYANEVPKEEFFDWQKKRRAITEPLHLFSFKTPIFI